MTIGVAEPTWGVVARLPWLWLVQRLPRAILARRYPADTVSVNIGVEIISLHANSLLTTGLPSVDFYLRYVNLNPFAISVDWVRFEVSIGHQPILDAERRSDVRIGPIQVVPPFAYGYQGFMNADHIYFSFHVDSGRADFLRNQPANWKTGVQMQIRLSLEGCSAAGPWKKRDLDFALDGDRVPGLR